MSTVALRRRWPHRRRRRAPEARRDVIAFLLALPVLLAAGVEATHLSDRYGALKVIWVVVAGLGALAALADLSIALCVLVLILPFPFKTKVGLGVEMHTTHFLLVSIILLVLYGFFTRRLRLPRGFLMPLCVMVFGAVIGALAGPDTSASLGRMVFGLIMPMFAGMAAAAALHPERDLRVMIILVAISLTGAGLLALLQTTGHAPGPLAPTFEGNRVNGLFEHPNILGAYLAAGIVLLLGVGAYAWRQLPLGPIVVLGPVPIGIAGLAVTLSRGALLALAVAILVILALMLARRAVLPVLMIVLAVVVIVFVAVPRVPESQRAAYAARFQQLLQPGTETGRQLIYHDAFTIIGQYPLTGVGPLTFGVITAHHSPIPLLEQNLTHAHDIFLEGYLSLGPIGLLAFLWLAAGAIRRLLRATRSRVQRANALVAGWAVGSLGVLTTMLVQGFTDFVFWQLEMMTFLMLLLGAAYAIGEQTSRIQAHAQGDVDRVER